MSRDTATELEVSSDEQKLFDPSSLRFGPRQHAESSAVSAVSLAQPHIHEGYGFRPGSGVASPQLDATPERPVKSPIPDEYGLGWPGVSLSSLFRRLSDHHPGREPVNHDRYSQVYLITSQLYPRGASRTRGQTSGGSSNTTRVHRGRPRSRRARPYARAIRAGAYVDDPWL